jgi:macrolide transport system ATP-binding/permease protein
VRALNKVRLRLRSLFSRPDVERELEAELRFHLDQLVDENVAAGAAPDEARRLALFSIGGLTQFQEECRDMWQVNYIDDLLRDLTVRGASK